MRITTKQLSHFVATAQTGQVSRAAARCFVSQPSLTASLKKLENALEVPLFTRHADGLRLTAQGEGFLRHAQHVLMTLETATEEARSSASTVSGAVRLPITDTISQYLLPRILLPLRRQLPQIDIEFMEEDRAQIERGLNLGKHHLGVMLVSNFIAGPNIQIETLAKSPRRLWSAPDHPLAARKSVSLKEIAPLPYVLLDMDDHVRTVERYWGAVGMKPNVVFRSKSIEAVRSLVSQGLGVTILSDLVFRAWSHDGGRIRRTPIARSVPAMALGLAFRSGISLSPAAEAVANALRVMTKSLDRELFEQ
jgi:DNA-binding transcriptional LysR family regulator